MSTARKLKLESSQSDLGIEVAQSRRILVVDDEPGILQAYQDILNPKTNVTNIKSSRSKTSTTAPAPTPKSSGDQFEVVTVSNGEQALDAVKKSLADKKPFAMGFFDVLLGTGIDGIETVKLIHSIDPDMFAVLVTAYQDRHVNSIQEVFGNDFQDGWDYLNKPFSDGEILQKARNMVSMWNLRQLGRAQRQRIDEIKRQIADSEKTMTVAAVARSVSHEFGNILLQIMGRADLARNLKDVEEMRKAMEIILTASDHASQVLQRFKVLAKPSEVTVTFTKLNVAKPIDETVALMEHELRRRKIEIIRDIPDLPPIVASHTGLVQVFMNLVINAIHAMEDQDDGKIEFHAKLLDGEVEVRVRDSGPGIKNEHVSSVFEAFFTTKGEKGTGLGLSICKEIIEINHQGKMTVGNHPKGGAEFVIVLPIERGDES